MVSLITYAQSDIDVVYLKNGTRIECQITQIKNDSIFLSQFSNSHKILHQYALSETAIYLVNNFYSTPGEELIKASRNLQFGTGIILVGGTLAFLARKDDRQNLFDIGVGTAALGAIVCVIGFNNFDKAGKKMRKIEYQGDRMIFRL